MRQDKGDRIRLSRRKLFRRGGLWHERPINGDARLELLVIGDDLDYSYSVDTDEGGEAGADRNLCSISKSTVNPKEYLLAEIRENLGMETAGAISEPQLLNLYLNRIWRDSRFSGFTTLEEARSASYSDRIMTLVYTLEFPAGATRGVSVSYLTDGVMDRTETVSPKYSYTYLLSPAEHWADFGSLDIEIITPEEAPYLIESSLSFRSDGENRYTVRTEGLPDQELTFTLYEKNKVTLLDKLRKTAASLSYILYFLWPLIVVISIITVILTIRAVSRRKRSGK